MRRRLFSMKLDFYAKSFSFPTLSMVEYSSGYLLFISYSTICFWIDWVCKYKYTKIKGLDLGEITSLPNRKNMMNRACYFSHHRLTRLICVQWKFTKPVWLSKASEVSQQESDVLYDFFTAVTKISSCRVHAIGIKRKIEPEVVPPSCLIPIPAY